MKKWIRTVLWTLCCCLCLVAAGLALSVKSSPTRHPVGNVRLLAKVLPFVVARDRDPGKFRRVVWTDLQSTNYQQFVANLRAFGCPEQTVRDIVIMDIAKVYARKRVEAIRQGKPYEYWRAEDHTDHQATRRLAELKREQHKLVRDLLGVELVSARAQYWEDEGVDFDFLPEDKGRRVAALVKQFEAKEEEIYSRAQGQLQAKDEEDLRALVAQRTRELQSLLTPEERQQYDLRYSTIAQTIRSQLNGIEPTQEEFLRLYHVYEKYKMDMTGGLTTSQSTGDQVRTPERESAERAFQREFREALGEARFAELQRSHDPAYDTLVQVAQRYNLPPDLAGSIYEMKRQAEQQKVEIDSNPRLTPEQRVAALSAIARETEQALTTVLGSDVYHSYATVGGDWIEGLRRPDY